MNRVENKNQIVDINGYVHVINGRVLCFKSDLYDLSENSDDVKYLTEFVNGLPTKRCFDASFGDFTIYLFTKVSDGIAVTQGDLYVYLQELPQDVSEKVKAVIEEYHSLQALYKNNQIVDVGENVYVINKKPVYIYPDALDLHKAADVDEICRLVCDTGDDMAERLTRFGKDTMLVLGTEHEEGRYNISSGDIGILPDDIQKKVKAAIDEYIKVQKKEASVFEEEAERIEPTDFEKSIYYGVRDYFDYAVHLMEQITGLRIDAEYAEQILREYLASEGYMYYDATYHNIPWMLLYFCIAKPVYGKLVREGSPLYEMLKDSSDVVLKPTEGRDYYKVDKSGDWLDLQYSFILHERKVVDDEVREEIHFQLFSSDKQGIPVEKADMVLDINEYRFPNLIHSEDSVQYRNDELLKVASSLMPDL